MPAKWYYSKHRKNSANTVKRRDKSQEIGRYW